MERCLKVYILLSIVVRGKSTVDGTTYMDPLDFSSLNEKLPPGENPCNPLYWYPREIPEYCNFKITKPPNIKPPLPVPIPVVPPSVPIPQPMPIPLPQPPFPGPIPHPAYPVPPLPYGIPLAPTHPMIPVIHGSYVPSMYPNVASGYPPQARMVPGIPGIVSEDGGINILPFSDVYSDMLEKHKNRMIRRKLTRMLNEYDNFPNRKSYRRLRKYREMI